MSGLGKRIPSKIGCCANCAWHLAKEEWCLPKGIVICRPGDSRPCGIYQPKEVIDLPLKTKGKKV